MTAFLKYLQKNQWAIYAFTIVLLGLALFVNLGIKPFSAEDGLRGLKAFELHQSRDYAVPTLFGNQNYETPPLYSWLVIISTKVFGSWSNFALRFINAFAVILFGGLIFRFFRPLLRNSYAAFFVAAASVASVTILFVDSMISEVDICFSVVMFGQLISVYYWDDKSKWRQFLWSYFFASIGFFLKGYTVVLFTSVSFLVWFASERKFSRLFCIQHIAGIALLAFFVFGYAWIQGVSTQLSVVHVLKRYWFGARVWELRNFDAADYVLHFMRFPFQFLSSLLPWGIFVVLLFKKENRTRVWNSPLLRFSFLMVISTLLIFWISPANHLRYNFMFNPFVLLILITIFLENENQGVQWRMVNWLFRVSMISLPLSFLALPMVFDGGWSGGQWGWWVVILGVSVLMTYLFFTWEERKFVFVVVSVLLIKLTYNTLLLPYIIPEMKETVFKDRAMFIAEMTKDEELKIFSNSEIHEDMAFYIARYRDEILIKEHKGFDTTSLYILDEVYREELDQAGCVYEVIGDFMTHKLVRRLFVVRFSKPPIDPREHLKLLQ